MQQRKRKLLIAAVTLCGWLWLAGGMAAGDSWLTVASDGAAALKETGAAAAPTVNVLDADATGLRIQLDVPGVLLTERKCAGGSFVQLGWPDASMAGEIGAPAIPVVRRTIVVPAGAVVRMATRQMPAVALELGAAGLTGQVLPVQLPVPKIQGALEQAVFQYDPQAYALPWPAEAVVTSEFGEVREQRLCTIEMRPVAYDPASGTISLTTRMTVEVWFEGGAKSADVDSPLPGLARLVLNPTPNMIDTRGTGDYLIVVANSYASTIAPFADAKATQGFTVYTHTVADGTAAATIKTFIQGRYDNTETRPEYVLLVGDTDKIPYWTGQGEGSPPTDLPYVCMGGGTDWDPDIALGRFSVRSTAQLEAVIAKTLAFENGEFADGSYTSRAVFMASQDNYTVSEGTHNWVIDTYMTPNNIACDKLYCHTYNATTQQVRNAFNAGRLYGIYSGHGDTDYWADGPPFYQSDVQGLTNIDLCPFVCSFACLTGNYPDAECFMETWLLQPEKAAVTAWGSSVNSYWTEDDVLERRLFDVLFADYLRELGPCYNLTKYYYKQEMGSGATTRRYFEMYNLMGDPSVYIPDAEAALIVSPNSGLVSEGPEGGPFSPIEATYQLRNVADYSIDYVVTHDPDCTWVTLSGDLSGTLAPEAIVNVTVTINALAEGLPIGLHADELVFTNATDGIGDTARDVTLEVGRYVYHSTDVPKSIGDYQTVTSVTTVGDYFCIGDVDVEVNISHTYIGDLTVDLTSPTGTTVRLHNRSGGSTENLLLTYDDEGTAPDGPGALSDFDTESPLGTWTLTVSDQASGDTGTLNGWALRLLPAGEQCPPVAFDGSFTTPENTPVAILLQGSSPSGNPLDFIIVSLPAHGTLRDNDGSFIEAVPYTLPNGGDTVTYTPAYGYNGEEGFSFKVNDGVDSDVAYIDGEVGGPQACHQFLLDSDPGWTLQGSWQFGVPLGQGSHNGDPNTGHTGANVYGYNLAGDYTNNMSATLWLTTAALDCSNLSECELRFWRWLGVESSAFDHAYVQISTDGSSWQPLWSNSTTTLSEAAWSQQIFDIAAIADGQATVYLRWGIGPTDGSITYPGWNIDDVEIWAMRQGGEYQAGDLNCDGVVNNADIPAFVMALIEPGEYILAYPNCDLMLGDVDGNGEFNNADIPYFLELLLEG